MTDPWVYRSPSGEILTIAPVWDDEAEDWIWVKPPADAGQQEQAA